MIAALEGAGQRPLSLAGDSGETIVVLPHGGRVLGLYSAASDQNFLWTSAAVSSAKLAREHFPSDRWFNSGGDRTWLAPEIDFFYPHYPDTSRQYFQPRQLDPGHYDAAASDAQVILRNELSMHSFRRGWNAQLRITKTISVTSNPLARGATAPLAARLQFAGYRLQTRLEMLHSDDDCCRVGLWNLLQLPGGGEMLVPVFHETEPVVYFGDIPAGDLCSDSRCVRYRMSAPGEQKIGIDALAATGRAGYVLEDPVDRSRATFVVRSFSVDASGPYVDVPLHRPDAEGHAFQACNIDADYLGRFAELEYHAPAIGGKGAPRYGDDVSQVWAYRGSREAIAQAAMELLGVTV
ncbi:MAG: hypothetical protein DCC67_10000 [Planctomycetota bacterium]|nr:MAG: hypothetical protein DCC67_10000 [Planctomycetota bacterium]